LVEGLEEISFRLGIEGERMKMKSREKLSRFFWQRRQKY